MGTTGGPWCGAGAIAAHACWSWLAVLPGYLTTTCVATPWATLTAPVPETV